MSQLRELLINKWEILTTRGPPAWIWIPIDFYLLKILSMYFSGIVYLLISKIFFWIGSVLPEIFPTVPTNKFYLFIQDVTNRVRNVTNETKQIMLYYFYKLFLFLISTVIFYVLYHKVFTNKLFWNRIFYFVTNRSADWPIVWNMKSQFFWHVSKVV